jgi:type II secretory pathway pseudopilin PulG
MRVALSGTTLSGVAHRRTQSGFTMVELTVSLVAGLIVALAVAGLSKEATRTFNEEVRVSAAEAALRTAVDRLRADLQRASFMSTPNMQTDPKIATPFGQPNVYTALAALTGAGGTAGPGIATLAGIHYQSATTANTTANNGLALNAVNPSVAPAIIDIGGNMTSVEQFQMQDWSSTGGCSKINLAATSPAIFRMLNSAPEGGAADPNADTEMLNIFQPVAGNQFLVRIYDDTGRSQFLPTCATPPIQVAGMGAVLTAPTPYVYVQGTPLTTNNTGGLGGIGGNGAGRVYVNPVQVVRWEIVGKASIADKEQAVDLNGLSALPTDTTQNDPNKYDLMRSYLNSAGVWIAASAEIVAEYAVDLDFAFSVETGDTTGQTSTITTYDFGNANNQLVANQIKTAIIGPANPDPQRIRSVRFRLVTRTATADRSLNIAPTAPFVYRYCLNSGGCPTTSAAAALIPPQWARTRTVVTEVALPNQMQAFY